MDDNPEKFWAKIDVQEDNECWKWLRGKLSDGYGQTGWKGKHHSEESRCKMSESQKRRWAAKRAYGNR